MEIFESIGKKIRKVLGLEDFIKKVIRVNGKKIIATYYPESGEFWFLKRGDKPYGLTNAGVYPTITAIFKAFEDVDLRKISYYAIGKKERDIRVRDRLYARELKRRGYEEVSSQDFPQDYSWHGPHRTWVKKTRERSSGLERNLAVISVFSLILGTLLLFPAITGNTIADLAVKKTSFFGSGLLFIGLIIGFFWLKSKQR